MTEFIDAEIYLLGRIGPIFCNYHYDADFLFSKEFEINVRFQVYFRFL